MCETLSWDCGWQNSFFCIRGVSGKIIWMSSDHERFPYHNVQAYVRPRLNSDIFWDYPFEHGLNLHAHFCFMFCQFWLKCHSFLSQFFNAGFHINFWFLRITSLTITNDTRFSSNTWNKIVVYIKYITLHYITLHYNTLPYHTIPYHTYTSSTAQGGGGSFKNRKPIGEIGCCESGTAERSHWWTERCLISLTLSLSFSGYLPTYPSIYLSISPSIDLLLL